MYNLLISLGVSLVVAAGVRLLGFSPWAAIVPGVIAFIASYILLARRVVVKIQAVSTAVQKELQALPPNERERKQRVEKAVRMLEDALVWDKWQFLVGPEIHGQIAMIHYMTKDYERAEAHFGKASSRNYLAHAMRGALYYQRKDYSRMERSFEAAVKAGKKEGIVWSAYAWCFQQLKDKDKALRILARAVQQNPSDEKLKANLQALQNDKKMKMKAYEPMWWQFGLETPPMQMAGGPRVRFVRR